jgi:hypothetical protein
VIPEALVTPTRVNLQKLRRKRLRDEKVERPAYPRKSVPAQKCTQPQHQPILKAWLWQTADTTFFRRRLEESIGGSANVAEPGSFKPFLRRASMLTDCGKLPNEMRSKSGDFVRVFFRVDVE